MNENRDMTELEEDTAPETTSGGPATTTVSTAGPSADEKEIMMENLIKALKTVYDPEIPVDIYELGLIYKIDIKDDRSVDIDMTLTAPGCPVAGDMVQWTHDAACMVEGVGTVDVKLVFDPPWDMSRMSDEARVELNLI